MSPGEAAALTAVLVSAAGGGPTWLAFRRLRVDKAETAAETKVKEAQAAETIVDMATQQLENYKQDVAALRSDLTQEREQRVNDIARLRTQHAEEISQVRGEMTREMAKIKEQFEHVLAENHELRTQVALLTAAAGE